MLGEHFGLHRPSPDFLEYVSEIHNQFSLHSLLTLLPLILLAGYPSPPATVAVDKDFYGLVIVALFTFIDLHTSGKWHITTSHESAA